MSPQHSKWGSILRNAENSQRVIYGTCLVECSTKYLLSTSRMPQFCRIGSQIKRKTTITMPIAELDVANKHKYTTNKWRLCNLVLLITTLNWILRNSSRATKQVTQAACCQSKQHPTVSVDQSRYTTLRGLQYRWTYIAHFGAFEVAVLWMWNRH